MSDLKELNRYIIARDKAENGSHGLKLLRDLYMKQITRPIPVFFNYVTDNRLSAHVIHNNDLVRLCVTEAGYKLYTNNKDGYSANGGGYSKPDHVLDSFAYALVDHLGVLQGEDRQKYFQRVRDNFVAREI